MSTRTTLAVCAIAVCFAGSTGTGSSPNRSSPGSVGDGAVVRLWNQIATDAIVVTGGNAPASSGVMMAMVQLAMYDAAVAIAGGYRPYAARIDAPRDASIAAAVAQSAHDILVDLLPAQAVALDARLADTLAAMADGSAKSNGIWVGQQAAAGILVSRSDDGRFASVPYVFLPAGPGVYQPTPPAFSTTPLVPWVARTRPFTMIGPSQFRPDAPPPLHSRKWARAFNLTQAYGAVDSSVRTPEQSIIAIFWTEHTVQQWNRNIRAHAERLGLDDVDTARLLAVTNTAMADAWIGCWDAKYHYSFWRPVTAIQQGESDGNPDTVGDPSWLPFRTTPNHPEYPGAHGCVSTAASHALKRFFGSDGTYFPMDAVVGGVTYTHVFTRYTDAGAQARAARIFGGMHYSFSNDEGARLGRSVVQWIFENGFFRPCGSRFSDAAAATRRNACR
ncbi:MAG TPA: vanadium-dependent haloperoxidase [Vicinamibacterales bacterium]